MMHQRVTPQLLVVHDNERRLRWSGVPTAQRLVAVWPTPDDQAEVQRHLAQGGALLILIERAQAHVTAYRYELPGPHPGTDPTDDVIEISVTALDWLTPDDRERGLNFLHAAQQWCQQCPAALRPAALLEPGARQIRFLVQFRPHTFTTDEWLALCTLGDAPTLPQSTRQGPQAHLHDQ